MSRALAIARSHADAGVSALLVVASDGHEWVAHRVAGASAESASTVLRGDRATVIGRLSGAASGVDLVVVDAPPQWARTALRTVVSQSALRGSWPWTQRYCSASALIARFLRSRRPGRALSIAGRDDGRWDWRQ